MNVSTNPIIFDFNSSSNIKEWVIVNDDVMGGLSKSSIILNDKGHGEFSGYVTTENNGGFSSSRHNLESKSVSDFKNVVLKIKGDGKNYQFRIKKSRFDRASYITTFKTSGEWEIISIPLSDFYPSFRGYKLNKPNFDGSSIEVVTFLIANKKNEHFKLLIDSISLE
ncbi:MAG: CIA30 family protein [Bacteroidia bacterium]|nr:CIA30 family protein [Bacteroidia bacterium]